MGGKPGKALDEAYENLRVAVRAAYPENGDGDVRSSTRLSRTDSRRRVPTDYERWQPLHWVIEAPDVMVERGGFDAVIGNPPFLGGKKVSGAVGADLREWLVNQLAEGAKGHADLVAYFFLRAYSILMPTGTLGLIATNSVAQGDSREVSLDRMVEKGLTITAAIQSRSWPASSANLEYAAVWGTRGPVGDDVRPMADGVPVRRISTLLEPAGRVEGTPIRLNENSGRSFIGCFVHGMGFIVEPHIAEEWIGADSRNADVLFPYLNGEDLNSFPDSAAQRWAIDFNDWSEEKAAEYELPYAHVAQFVKPERQRRKADGTHALRNPLPQRWWQFGDKRPALRRAIAGLDEVLAIALVSKAVVPLRVRTGQVFSHALGIFASDSYADQAVLSSSLHQLWAITYGSTLETRVRYTPSDVFETFPRPEETDRLNRIGRRLNDERSGVMLRRELGLTKLYNLVNDPAIAASSDSDIADLRELHVELDHAVVDAYGWSGDVDIDHGFHTYRRVERWSVSPASRVEIHGRLLEENHKRAAAGAARGKRMRQAPESEDDNQASLFGDERSV